MSRLLSFKSVWVIVILFILLVLAGLFVPGGSHVSSHAISRGNMERIADAISTYAADHEGKMPESMSVLFPHYLVDPRLLEVPGSSYRFLPDLSAHQELIDTFSPYTFLRLKDGRILVMERPGLWKDGKITYFMRGKLPGPMNYMVDQIYPKEVVQRFENGFPDPPPDRDYQMSMSTRVHSHEYELNYTGHGLQAINKAFQASGKPPITSDAARSKVQAAIKHLDPAVSWEADNGSLNSDGSTPYYVFRCAPSGCVENGPSAALLVGHSPIGGYSLLAPCGRAILNATVASLFMRQHTYRP